VALGALGLGLLCLGIAGSGIGFVLYDVLTRYLVKLPHPSGLSFTHKSPTPQKEGARLKIPVVAVPTEADLPELTPLMVARTGFAKRSAKRKVAVTQKKPVLDV
jgi:hypothetical protein